MRETKTRLYVTAFLASVLTVGAMLRAPEARAEFVEILWDGDQRFERALEVLPGKFAEVCGKMSRGQAIAWTFEANRAVDFNVHYHEGARIVFPAKHEAATKAAGRLMVELDQDFCWMWTNKSVDKVRVSLTLQR